MLQTRFTREYGLRHPIAGAGLAFGTVGPALTVAVSEAGALGAFAAGILPLTHLRETLAAIRARTARPYNLNLITPFATEEHLDLALEARPAVVSFHWRHPRRSWIERLHAAGIRVWEQVGTPEDAVRAAADGVDLVVAQGAEAGGHCYGSVPTLVLVPAVVDAVPETPVLAAGGIADGRGLAAALALGADGAWIGTRLLATEEADIAEEYKARLVAARTCDTLLTSAFGTDVPEFNPMRVLANRAARTLGNHPPAAPPPVVGEMELAGTRMQIHRGASLLPVRGAQGDFEEMALAAGQSVGLVRDILPAAQVIERIAADAARVLASLARP